MKWIGNFKIVNVKMWWRTIIWWRIDPGTWCQLWNRPWFLEASHFIQECHFIQANKQKVLVSVSDVYDCARLSLRFSLAGLGRQQQLLLLLRKSTVKQLIFGYNRWKNETLKSIYFEEKNLYCMMPLKCSSMYAQLKLCCAILL